MGGDLSPSNGPNALWGLLPPSAAGAGPASERRKTGGVFDLASRRSGSSCTSDMLAFVLCASVCACAMTCIGTVLRTPLSTCAGTCLPAARLKLRAPVGEIRVNVGEPLLLHVQEEVSKEKAAEVEAAAEAARETAAPKTELVAAEAAALLPVP